MCFVVTTNLIFCLGGCFVVTTNGILTLRQRYSIVEYPLFLTF